MCALLTVETIPPSSVFVFVYCRGKGLFLAPYNALLRGALNVNVVLSTCLLDSVSLNKVFVFYIEFIYIFFVFVTHVAKTTTWLLLLEGANPLTPPSNPTPPLPVNVTMAWTNL